MTLTALGLGSMLFVGVFTLRTYYAGENPRQAIIEAWVNIVIGFSINFVANLILFPLMVGVHVSPGANFWGGWIYTAISVLRQYAIRRWFQEGIHSFSSSIAARIK